MSVLLEIAAGSSHDMTRAVTAQQPPDGRATATSLVVAIQGERGAFSELAVRSLFGHRARILPCPEFDTLFRAAEAGRCRYALAPIENTIAGSIHRVHDLLLDSPLKVAGEAVIRVSHALMALPGVRRRDVRRVYSHPVALAQCERFFRKHPRLTRVATYDTAGSVRLLREEGARDAAAIAPEHAARLYGARILTRGLEDHRANFTRFFALSRDGERAILASRLLRKGSRVVVVSGTSPRVGATNLMKLHRLGERL